MRICIITQPLKANYGGILQNYALQIALKRMGHTPVTIDYIYQPSIIRYLLSICKTILLRCLGKRCSFAKLKYKRKENIQQFVNKHIIVTEQVHEYRRELVSRIHAEAIIVGSDQVWRAIYNQGVLEDMFLKFSQGLDIKRIAYAASFGISDLDYSQKQVQICSTLIKNFDLVSVREESGVELCQKYFGVSSIWVCDPSLFLNMEDYVALCADIPTRKYKFIVAYILDSASDLKERIKAIAHQNALEVVYITADNNLTISIEEWLALFRDTEFVITNSFHGTIFSIIFNKPFYSLYNDSRGNTRLSSLLSKFDLSDRRIISLEKLDYNIDWEKVNKKRTQFVNDSIAILASALC